MVLVERFVSSSAAGGNDGSTEALAWTFAEMLAQMVAGQRSNVKADGTYTLAGAGNQTFVAAGATDLAPFIIEGYTTTPQDGGRATIVATSGFFDWSQNTVALKISSIRVRSMIFRASQTGNVVMKLANASSISRCDIENTSGTFANKALFLRGGATAGGCSIKTDSSNAAATSVFLETEAVLFESAVRSATVGMIIQSGSAVQRCLIVSAGATGAIGVFVGSDAAGVFGCTIFDFTDLVIVSDVSSAGSDNNVYVANCLLYQGANGVTNQDAGATTNLIVGNTALGSITGSFFVGFGDNPDSDTITLTADPFANSASDDFSLNAAAGGGALARNAALQVPTLIP